VADIPAQRSFPAKHPEETRTRFLQSLPLGRSKARATRSSSRQNTREPGSRRAVAKRVDTIPKQRPFMAKHLEETRTRFSQSLPSGRSRARATRSSSRQNTREPGSLRAGQNNAWMTFAASALHHATRARSTRTQRRARFDAMTPGLRDDSPGCMRDEYSSQQTTKKAVIIMNNKGLCLRGLKACVGKKNDGNQTRTNTKA